MNALNFAELFIEDLPDLLKNRKPDNELSFSIGVYEDDPELKVLKSELNKIGYNLICVNKNRVDKITDQKWNLIKIK